MDSSRCPACIIATLNLEPVDSVAQETHVIAKVYLESARDEAAQTVKRRLTSTRNLRCWPGKNAQFYNNFLGLFLVSELQKRRFSALFKKTLPSKGGGRRFAFCRVHHFLRRLNRNAGGVRGMLRG